MTLTQTKALQIIRDHAPIRPGRFADLMWPNSPAHTRSYNCGPYGATRGSGLVLSAGSYLAKLARAGLIIKQTCTINGKYYNAGYVLTDAGLTTLKSAEQKTQSPSLSLGGRS